MKQIFTLALASLACIAHAQDINETLENYTSGSDLTGRCWSLSGAGFSNGSYLNGANCFVIVPATSSSTSLTSNNARISTPFINWADHSIISFNYKLSSKLSTQADRTIEIGLQSLDGTFTSLGTQPLNKYTPVTTQTFSYTLTSLPADPVQRLVINVTGNGDGNSWLFIDDLGITGASYNTGYPYDCKSAASTLLPVRLTSFTGCVVDNKAQLKWSVAENETGHHFEIEKSTDGVNYSVVGQMPASGASGVASYIFNEDVVLSSTAYYRIKFVNNDQTKSYTRSISLKNGGYARASGITLMQNPIQSVLSFQYDATVSEDATVNIYNMTGVKLQSFSMKVQKGANAVLQPLNSRVLRGTYILEVTTNTQRSAVKLTK